MLYEQTKNHILGLSDADLVEYVLTGARMYEPDAVAFAREELNRRNLPSEQLAGLRRPIVTKLTRYDATTPPDPTRRAVAKAVVCDGCGLEAPTQYVSYQQNVGAIVLRFSTVDRGHYCKRCNRRAFWSNTVLTFFVGWWGVISFFITISFLVGNVVTFIRTRSLAPAPAGAARPSYDDLVLAKMNPYTGLVGERLIEGIDPADIAREVAPLAGVTPGQAWCLIVTLRSLDRREQERRTARIAWVPGHRGQGFREITRSGWITRGRRDL